jgi:hypothetical protein
MEEVRIIGIYVPENTKDAVKLQALFTKYGNVIRTRLGLNEVVNEYAIPGGLILLELSGEQHQCNLFENELFALESLDIQKMNFSRK